MALIFKENDYNRKIDTPEGSAVVINKFKENHMEVNVYILKKGYSFHLNPPQSEGAMKTYWILSGLIQNTDTDQTHSTGHMIVLDSTHEVFHVTALEETQLLVHSLDDNSYDKTEEGFRYVFGLLKQIQDKDAYTLDHCNRVHQLAKKVGLKKGYTGQRFLNFLLAAKYHDVGKIYIPDAILNKPDRLDDEEYNHMKTHIISSQDILNQFFQPEVYLISSQHHERMDGTGYPLGLVGEAISEESRIIAICDSYDAMTSERVYKPAKSKAVAIAELRSMSPDQYDSELVELFIETLGE